VLLAGRKDSPQSRQALDELCRHYWYPVYAFLRRQTHNHQDASDLVQGFFQYLQERELIGKANPSAGVSATFC
jgi:RNA polymerase sigma-70 factor (ECF subfamily)